MFSTSKIKSIRPLGKQKVYDLTVSVDHSFIANNFVVHNCKGPNLQNIPRDTTSSDIKRMFIPPPGQVLLEVDYGQAELRVIAEVSEDKAMIEIFEKGYNIHVATACKMFGGIEQYDYVKKLLKDNTHKDWLMWEKRKKLGKSLNFSIVYCQGDPATAATLGCTKEEAGKFKAEWFKQFPQAEKWINQQKKIAMRDGYVRNMFGRKRRLYNIYSDNFGLRAEAERQAVNAPIQGTSGDFALFSQVVIREKILRGELPRNLLQVYTVHDSIGFYLYPNQVHQVVNPIIEICNDPQTKEYFNFHLKHVKMKVSPEVGNHWAALEEYNPEIDYSNLLKKPL